MDHPKVYLLRKIIGYKENGLQSLGELNAKHIDDISNVMMEFGKEAIKEVIDGLNKGQNVDIGGEVISLRKKKRKRLA